jgi:hypothetical protein
MLILAFGIYGTVFGMAQDACKPKPLDPPVFCQDMPSTAVRGDCENTIRNEYIQLLDIAEHNWEKFLSFSPVDSQPYGSHLQYEQYGRCAAENKEHAAEAMFFDVIPKRFEVIGLSEPLPIETPNIRLDENQDRYKCFAKNEKGYLTDLGKLVGRLEIKHTAKETGTHAYQADYCKDKDCKNYPSMNTGKKIDYAQWGTAIQITDNAAVTSCHALESLVDRKNDSEPWHLALAEGEDLVVDFGERDDQFELGNEYKVSDIWVPNEEGLDVAVLKIAPYSGHSARKLPEKVKWGMPVTSSADPRREVAVVGFPDFHHPLDPCAEAAFGAYKTQGASKFVSLGCARDISTFSTCEKKVKEEGILFHTATTTMGESGSILVDRKDQTIIGVHVCCSYPQDDMYSRPPAKLPCARTKRAQYNQAVSVCKIFQNPKLVEALQQRNIKLPQVQCPKAEASKGGK